MEEYKILFKIPRNELDLRNERFYFKRPEILDIIEFDGLQLKTSEGLRYFKEPKATAYPLDLNEGFENYKFRDESFYNSNLGKLEEYLMRKDQCPFDDGPNEKCKIYTQRSVLYRLMLIPYRLFRHAHNNQTICATKFNDIIYMAQATEQDRQYSGTKNDSYHFKFEQYCFSDSPETEPRTDVPIDENKQTYCIYRSQLREFNFLYSAEIKGVCSDTKIQDMTDLNELNRCRFAHTKLLWDRPHPWRTMSKVLNWWVQAYLTKVDDIYFGFKDKEGFINSPVLHTSVRDLPKNQKWDPNVCTGFLHRFMSMVEMQMSGINCPYTVFEFKYDSFEAEKCVKYKIHEGKTKHSFLSDEFVKHLKEK